MLFLESPLNLPVLNVPLPLLGFYFYILLNLVLAPAWRRVSRMRWCRLEREGINAKLLSLMALITLALAPVALLLMFQIKFLPYHSEPITWLHRGLLALDLALVRTLWPGY